NRRGLKGVRGRPTRGPVMPVASSARVGSAVSCQAAGGSPPRRRPGGGITGDQAHGPADQLQPHRLNLRPIPGFGGVTEAVVDDAPLAVLAGPDHGEVAVPAADVLAGEVDLARVEAEQDADPVAREVLDLIDLVSEREGAGEVAQAGEGGVLDDQG